MCATPLRAIFFDAGNTLIRMDYAAIAAALAREGVDVGPESLERAEWRARVRLDRKVLARMAPGHPEASTEHRAVARAYLEYLLDELGIRDGAVVDALAAWRETYNPPVGLWTAMEPSAPEALQLTRAAGLTAAVISNSNGSVRAILDELGLTRWLDDVIDSGNVGVEKPDPRIFRIALERAGVQPSEAVYIGDLYSVDVVGARAAGLDAVLLDPGACWGDPGCRRARDTAEAVRLALARAAAP